MKWLPIENLFTREGRREISTYDEIIFADDSFNVTTGRTKFAKMENITCHILEMDNEDVEPKWYAVLKDDDFGKRFEGE